MIGVYTFTFGQNYGSFDNMLKFTHVARKVVHHEKGAYFSGDGIHLLTEFPGIAMEKIAG